MRILSQEDLYDLGNIDLPYEMCGLSMGYMGDMSKFFVYAHFQGADNKMAEYSSAKKARKAMEMLHGAYCGEIYMKCGDYEVTDIDLSQELEKKIREEMSKAKFLTTVPNPVVECKIFLFPSDDEVEV